MSHVPRLICANCDFEMRCETIGVDVGVETEGGDRHYIIGLDLWVCSDCDTRVYRSGETQRPHTFHHETGFAAKWKKLVAMASLR